MVTLNADEDNDRSYMNLITEVNQSDSAKQKPVTKSRPNSISKDRNQNNVTYNT